MATLTNEQIEQKKQQLKQLAEEAKQLKDELVEAGAWPMDEDDLDKVAGGIRYEDVWIIETEVLHGDPNSDEAKGNPSDPAMLTWMKENRPNQYYSWIKQNNLDDIY